MKTRAALCPDEWMSAAEAGKDLFATSKLTSHGILKIAISVFLPFAIGALCFVAIDSYLYPIHTLVTDDVVRSILTFVAVLAGFMVTTILFTGKPNGLAALNSHELSEVRDKISYLVLSQCITLASHLASSIVAIVAILLPDTNSYTVVALALLAGSLLNSLLRAFILPLQIWEVHAFALDVEIVERQRAEYKLIHGDSKD